VCLQVIDYPKFAVIIKEWELMNTSAVLRAIPEETVCQMRKEAARVYHAHFQSFEAQVETYMSVLEARQKGTARQPPVNWREVCDGDGSTYNCESPPSVG
jgi:hypothetical protein